MLESYIPKYNELWFRKQLLADSKTMSYNHAYGGTIDFPEDRWEDWYSRWIKNNEGKRFYRYLRNENGDFVGEIAYYPSENRYIASIIIYSMYRKKGYGKEGLLLLCDEAKKRGIEYLYDDIAADNQAAIGLFLNAGFCEDFKTDEIIMLKKRLAD